MAGRSSFDRMWDELAPVGRSATSGGYRRFAWTRTDSDLREWFAGEAADRGLALVLDRAGNQWAWWGEPSAARPGVVIGSHLDSVPDGGAFDGPLGVVSAFAVVDALRLQGIAPVRPIGIVNFADEEGARFGIACAGSRLITGALDADRARGLRDADATSMAEAMRAAGLDPGGLGPDRETLDRIGCFVELHVEQGRGLVELSAPVAVGSQIWPHGRWRIELPGEANHAGTTRLADRQDPMLAYARLILAARDAAERRGSVATMGKVSVSPNGVNAIPSLVTAWLDARGPDAEQVLAVVAELRGAGRRVRGRPAPGVLDRGHQLSTPGSPTGSVPCWAACRCWAPVPGTTPASSPMPASPPRCCSCATRPASRTRRPSTPNRPTAMPGSAR